MKIFVGILFCCVLCVQQVGANLAFDFPASLVGNETYNGQRLLATTFTPTVPITVTQLGAFDSGADGFGNLNNNNRPNVAIYSVTVSGGNITAGTMVPTGTSVAQFNQAGQPLATGSSTRLFDVADFTLNAGTTYAIVAGNYGGSTGSALNYRYNLGSPTQPSDGSGGSITWLGNFQSGSDVNNLASDLMAGAGGWTSLGLVSGGVPMFAAGNFEFNLVPVPEAAQFGLASVAVLGLVFMARCGARARKAKA